MLLLNQHPHNKSIMVSLIGLPNAGKSTLINKFLGFDLSIVSKKPQTTRNQFQCSFCVDKTEVVLVDTPGIHKSSKELNKRMIGQAEEGQEGVDLNLVLLDITRPAIAQLDEIVDNLGAQLAESIIVFTKSDLSDCLKLVELERNFLEMKEKYPFIYSFYVVSSDTGSNIPALTQGILDKAQPGPHLYPDGEVSNKNERFFVSEYIREQAFRILRDELPYELAVTLDEFKDTNDRDEKRACTISATILVNRPSQRAIVIGAKGSVIKRIGINSRKKIEAMVGGKAHLNLHVKVSPHWYKNNYILEEIGLPRVHNSARVWRKK